MEYMKLAIFFSVIMTFTSLDAQTQHGYVKTKGRLGKNGTVIAGTRLQGATVLVKGANAVVSGNNGTFALLIPTSSYYLQSVQKQGYVMTDPDALSRQYTYSKNPLVLVLETPAQHMDDKLSAEKKIRCSLQRQLQEKENEIEALKEQNKLTDEAYRQQLQDLYAQQESNERLISEMAQKYAKVDYDQMSSLDCRISYAILNGNLTEADSLLRSKGSIQKRIADIRKEQQIEALENEVLSQRQKNLKISKAGTLKKLEDVASDCYSFFESFCMTQQYDSALYYIELRANCDTTNAIWQYDAANYCKYRNKNKKAEFYFLRAIDLFLHFPDPRRFDLEVQQSLNSLRHLYLHQQRQIEVEKMYLSVLATCLCLAIDDSELYTAYITMVSEDLTKLYYDSMQQFDKSMKICLKGLSISNQLASIKPKLYRDFFADWLMNMVNFYNDTQQFDETEKMLTTTLNTYVCRASNEPEAFEAYVGMVQKYLGDFYYNQQRYEEAERLYSCSKRTYQHAVTNNRECYPEYVNVILILANIYEFTERFSEAETSYKEALEISRWLAKSNLSKYEGEIVRILGGLADFYKANQRFSEAEETEKEYIAILQNHRTDTNSEKSVSLERRTVSNYSTNIMYFDTLQCEEAEIFLLSVLEIYQHLYDISPREYETKISKTLCDLSLNSIFLKKYHEAEKFALKSLQINPMQIKIYTHLAAALLLQGRYSEAEGLFRRYKRELKDSFINDFKQFAKAGVIPKEYDTDVERIKKMLNEE